MLVNSLPLSQLFSYPTSISSMSGVNPVSPFTTTRAAPRGRWNNPFMMEEDFSMMPHPINSSAENSSVIMMDEGQGLVSEILYYACLTTSSKRGWTLFNRIRFILDRFFQAATTTSSDSPSAHLNHGLIVASTAITCASDHTAELDHHTVEHHQIDKHGNLVIATKSEVL